MPPIRSAPHLATRLLAALLALASGPLAAAPDPFKRGVELFKRGEYEEAIQHFKQARREGNGNPVLRYNLGVSYYRLGRYRSAREQFLAITDHPRLGPVAAYNLGLVAWRLKEERTARRWFERAAGMEDESIAALAARQIEKLDQRRKKKGERWSGYLSAGLGVEDNVTRINDGLTLTSAQSDTYWSLYASFGYRIEGNRKEGTQLKFGAGRTRYSTLGIYDQALANVGLYRFDSANAWRLRYGAHYYYDELDGNGFQERINLSARATRRFGNGHRLRFQYDLAVLDELDATYGYLDGTRQRLRAEHTLQRRDVRVRLRYTLELNDRADRYIDAANFISYSPTRHTLLASVKAPVAPDWQARVDLEYRTSRYRDATIEGGVDLGRRQDDRLRASLYGTYRIDQNTDLELRLRHTRNDSNFAEKRYTNNSLLVSVDYFF